MARDNQKRHNLKDGQRSFDSVHCKPAIPFFLSGRSDGRKRRTYPRSLLLKLLIMLILPSFLLSCAVDINNVRQHARGYYLPPLEILATENSEALAWYRENEWQFNRGDKTQPPEQCLCLSGGGIRSAGFSIGVLRGLHEKEILEKIDIISGVSGGSYALSWYYLQQYGEDRKVREDSFSDTYLDKLISQSKMYTHPEIALSALGYAVSFPANIVLNRIFSLNADAAFLRGMYERALRRTFHDGKDPTFPEALELIHRNNLPYFIINTSAAIDYSPSHDGSKLANRVFEFTPLRFGSDGFGYSNEFAVTMGRAVSISGAAVDFGSQVPGRLESALVSSLNVDLGYHIENYNNKAAYENVKRLIPFYFLVNSNDRKGTDVYLTDGGHSENLGMYSLVRRLCRRIIVVDATFDPDYRFEAYSKLKNALRGEMQVEFEIEEIDRLLKSSKHEDKNTEPNAKVNGEPCEECRRHDMKNRFDTSKPVLKGSVAYFPIKLSDNTIEERRIDVTYIKLSIDDGLFDGFPSDDPLAEVYGDARAYYGKDLVEYYLKAKMHNDCGEWLFGCGFPHHTTWDQNYTSKQLKAYIDLGYHIVRNEMGCESSGHEMSAKVFGHIE